MKKSLLLLALCAGIVQAADAQCSPVATFDENFDAFTTFPENCWTGSPASGPITFFNIQDDADDPGGKEALFYGFTGVGSNYYLVSPELTTIDGNHYLTFDGTPVSSLGFGLIVQVGTLSSATDFSTFVAHGDPDTITDLATVDFTSINIPAAAEHKFIAVKFTPSGMHQSLRLDNFKWNTTEEPCMAVDTLNEGFDDFTDFPGNCWNASAAYPNFYLEDDPEKYVTFYSFDAAGTPFYLVTPELSNIDGNHILSFTGSRGGVPGDVKVQFGTLSSPDDYTTFTAYGEELAISSTGEETYESIAIPAAPANKYMALKITPTAGHQMLAMDDFIWKTAPASTKDLHAFRYALYPNPASSVIRVETEAMIREAVILDITGKVILTQHVNKKAFTINVSDLPAGVYFLQLRSGDGVSNARFNKM